jgi:chaperonin GroES
MDLPKLKFSELQKSQNLTDKFTETQLSELGHRVHQDFTNDDATRDGWKDRNKEAMKLALQVAEKKSTPWPNASNVKFPLLSQAALQFQVRAYGAMFQGPEYAKHRVIGSDPDGQKAARASRVSQHMNYQCLEDEEWEECHDRMLMVLPIAGLCFIKRFWSVEEQRIKTDIAFPQKVVIPYRAKSLETTPRISEIIELYEREIKEKQLAGVYREVELAPAPQLEVEEHDIRDGINSATDDTERPREVVEQHLYLDLDGDGYSEPYTVTIDRSTRKILRIVQRFGLVRSEQSEEVEQLNYVIAQARRQAQELFAQLPQPQQGEDGQPIMDDQSIQMAQQIQMQAEQINDQIERILEEIKELQGQEQKIKLIRPVNLYTKYSFIPAPDGSFYDIGFGQLLGPLNSTVNSLINQLLDAGSLSNGSQGFMGKGARMKGGKITFAPFTWNRVNVMGSTLRDSIVPLPVNPPNAVLFNLLGLLIEYTKDLSSVNDAMSGKDMGQNTPAYNMEAMLNQGMQVFSGIFKRVHKSLRRELQLQYNLNAVYLNPEEYYAVLDGDAKVLQKDYWGDHKDVYPAADPNAFSQQEKAQKAQFLAQRSMAVPHYDPVAIEKRLLESMDVEDRNEVFPLDEQGQPSIPAPKNPELEIEVLGEQRR